MLSFVGRKALNQPFCFNIALACDSITSVYLTYRGACIADKPGSQRPSGIYYRKIKDCSAKLHAAPNSMQILRDMVK
ncbi:hypothetical protein [Pseudomonas sp. A-RE-19]|uniref:hypothetical protein n=1 Tax=Pseudomonas sp. A-RE-19 TaxID=2832401 RepID=UPI001CC04C50|nr:hypothetical protein [Pseudomonas sp. A-RE-19]